MQLSFHIKISSFPHSSKKNKQLRNSYDINTSSSVFEDFHQSESIESCEQTPRSSILQSPLWLSLPVENTTGIIRDTNNDITERIELHYSIETAIEKLDKTLDELVIQYVIVNGEYNCKFNHFKHEKDEESQVTFSISLESIIDSINSNDSIDENDLHNENDSNNEKEKLKITFT